MLERAVFENCWEMEPGLYRVLLPLPWAVPFVNAYLLRSGDQWLLLDCGLNYDPSLRALGRAMRAAGVPQGGLHALLLTHRHSDHSDGAAPVLQRWGGIAVLHRADAEVRVPGRREEVLAWLARHGVGPDTIAQMAPRKGPVLEPLPARLETVVNGQVLSFGDLRLDVHWAPGHSPGHVLLREPERGWLFCGDHVLAGATQNVWFGAWQTGDPVGDYLSSLERAQSVPCRLVLPGHGLPFPAQKLAATCREMAAYHRRRAARYAGVLQVHGPMTAWAVGQKEAPRAAGGVANVGEVVAVALGYLHYLEGTGAAQRRETDSQVLWAPA